VLSSFLVPSPSELFPRSLHDALPISIKPARTTVTLGPIRTIPVGARETRTVISTTVSAACGATLFPGFSITRLVTIWLVTTRSRSEEHTSELQSRENLVCRHLLEKKK